MEKSKEKERVFVWKKTGALFVMCVEVMGLTRGERRDSAGLDQVWACAEM
jgi:hypothetical protein